MSFLLVMVGSKTIDPFSCFALRLSAFLRLIRERLSWCSFGFCHCRFAQRQCLDRCIPDMPSLERLLPALRCIGLVTIVCSNTSRGSHLLASMSARPSLSRKEQDGIETGDSTCPYGGSRDSPYMLFLHRLY